jgi:DNA-binding beta-propeller fold protein YncE
MFRTPLPVLAAAGGILLSACGLNQEGVPPPQDAIFFPASALADPAGDWLYVTNSNSDLRYNDGTLVAVDTRVVDSVMATSWGDCPNVGYIHPRSDPNGAFCCWDLLDRSILNCDERQFIDAGATVKIGSFSAGIAFQPSGCPTATPNTRPCSTGCDNPDHADGRLFMGIRGNSSITWADVKHAPDGLSVQLNCSQMGGDFQECDAAHEVTTAIQTIESVNGQPVLVPDEPYALTLDAQRQLLYVGHLKGDNAHLGTGGMSLIDVADPTATPLTFNPITHVTNGPHLVDVLGAFFPFDVNGLVGVTALTLVPTTGEVFACSRYVPRVGGVVSTNPPPTCDTGTTFAQIALIPTSDQFDTTLVGSEVRGVQFLPDEPNRAWVLQRVPPAMIGFDLGIDPTGANRIMPSNVVETCDSPTFLQARNVNGGACVAGANGAPTVPCRFFITCFQSGQVYAFDPYTPRITDIIEVDRGPAGLAFGPDPGTPGVPPSQTTRAYVVGFSENNISVIDLQPGSPTEMHVIMRIGFPSTTPR